VLTKRLTASFETFTGSVEHTRPEKFPRNASCVQAFFFRKSLKPPGCQSVKSTVCMIGSGLLWHYCMIIRCAIHTCAP